MKWDQHNPAGHGRHRGPSDGWMAQFLRREAERQAEMLDAIHARLKLQLEKLDPERLPSEDWLRAARFAQDGFRHLATLELETARVTLLAQRVNGKAPMSDEEYEAKLRDLGRDALDTQPVEELEAAIARRRALAVPR